MNIDHHSDRSDGELPDGLRHALGALRRDTAPEHDLWPGIRSRIEQARPATPSATAALLPGRNGGQRRRRPRRLAALATAASLAAVLAIGWTVVMAPSAPPRQQAATTDVILREAMHMTHEYRTAWQAFDARRPTGVDASALREIDRNAAAVRAALRRDPGSRYLLDRLQSLYALRLDVSRRLSSIPS